MKTYHYSTASSEETIALGKKIGERLKKGDVLALQGTLGAGKTTITKGIALALGIDETITSPTFCLISEYNGEMPLYHMDIYRLGGAEDFADLGTDDMIYGNGVCVIEWSEKIMGELPQNTIVLKIEKKDTNTQSHDTSQENGRIITLENWQYGDL